MQLKPTATLTKCVFNKRTVIQMRAVYKWLKTRQLMSKKCVFLNLLKPEAVLVKVNFMTAISKKALRIW